MKKIISCLMAVLLVMVGLTACTSGSIPKNKKLSIVCTIFPEYDWTREILGSHTDTTDLTLLMDNGVDLHSYQPTADDIIKISSCDMLVYVGGISDKWIEDAVKEATNKDMVVVNLLDVLGDSVKEEEIVEGMQAEEEEHDHESEEDHDHEEIEYDEHVWLSLKNSSIFCNYIAEKLAEVDSDNANDYKENAKAYIEKLNTLDKQYQDAVDNASQKTVLFGDRFPFRYLVDDYGLSYYAAFVGCSAETEASFETVAFLSKKVDELNLSSVIILEKNDGKIAGTIIDNTQDKNQKILTLNSLQSTTSEDVKNGTTYLSTMENNLKVLKEALN